MASGTNTTAVGQGASAVATNSVALGAGSIANQPNTVSVGSPGSERRITNVAPGINGTDAVNMNQLQQVQGSVSSVAAAAYSGVAAATALAMIPPVDPGHVISVGVGEANYHGYSAGAIGVTVRVMQNLQVRAGAGITGSGTTFGVGAAYQW
ncbi:YadA-like family protein [Burkholderia seminalis]|nr:YadA-like family protein [Burkholderia seminalis]